MNLQIGDECKLHEHIMQIKSIQNHQFGKIIIMTCYFQCCTIPNIMKIQCSEKDAIILRNNYLKEKLKKESKNAQNSQKV